uniref:Uncharacterized protein n=1 Tax=Neobodo designis TaxID=312471 RepID=A0A7S1W9E6_NEODS
MGCAHSTAAEAPRRTRASDAHHPVDRLALDAAAQRRTETPPPTARSVDPQARTSTTRRHVPLPKRAAGREFGSFNRNAMYTLPMGAGAAYYNPSGTPSARAAAATAEHATSTVHETNKPFRLPPRPKKAKSSSSLGRAWEHRQHTESARREREENRAGPATVLTPWT